VEDAVTAIELDLLGADAGCADASTIRPYCPRSLEINPVIQPISRAGGGSSAPRFSPMRARPSCTLPSTLRTHVPTLPPAWTQHLVLQIVLSPRQPWAPPREAMRFFLLLDDIGIGTHVPCANRVKPRSGFCSNVRRKPEMPMVNDCLQPVLI
jgi:hypothetical protein